MYPILRTDPPMSAWIERTAADLAAFGEEHRTELDIANRANRFPRELYAELGRRGYLGPLVPTEWGGLGGGVAEYSVIAEEVGRHGLVSGQIAAQGQRWLLDWGTAEQQERWLRGIATGEIVFSECISEKNAGSSFKAMASTAVRDGEDWILTGSKTHINLGADCDVTLFYAVAEEGLTCFLVDMTLPGIRTHVTRAIGLRLIRTADVVLDEVRVPDAARLGPAGGGLQTFLSTFNISRLGNASELIGLGRRSLELGLRYAGQRQVGDQLVTDFQGIQWTVADAWTALQAASLARDDAALAHARGEDLALRTTTAKRLAITAAERANDAAYSLVGGHGLYHDTPYTDIDNDIKVLKVAGGSAEIMNNYIARCVLRDEGHEGLA
ncbi:Acyl-CoA dehydrogenase domain protein [Nostocoides japonicum T1-X7]|uniref:Acyl-CoA dehydrogenase domain protein n=1 Tax=Nostocoides japonicum T1-X7 TaxID=1194083 RepID=A0A077M196_9MICO|nr:acyl-CoA dehydrogenase family protein [Tetrasphaera japonica]CCH78852.1 Acyl-CoA dehydrogenase domain protein [Tetrasphaera japonica T1-X7]